LRKNILVVCGNGVATSVVASKKIESYLKSQNIDARVSECKVQDVQMYANKVDLIVSMPLSSEYPTNIPVVKGLPFITGRGVEETLLQIKEILTKQ
jgi:PTS system galactitol-specific IIB component